MVKLKVLQITGGLGRGGLETFTMNLFRSLPENEVVFDFAVYTKGGAYEKELLEHGVKIFCLPKRRRGFLKYWKAWDSFFKIHAKDYDAVHLHESTLSPIDPLFFAKKYGVKVRVLHSHSSSVAGNKLHYILHYFNKLFVHSWATDYLGCSDKALDWFYNWTGVRKNSILIKNGILLEKYRFNTLVRDKVRHEFGIDKGDFVVGHVGRFTWIKNHKFLIDVFFELKERKPNSKLILIGEGTLKEDVIRQVNNLGMTKEVIFAGLRSDVNELLMAMDCFVMPSHYEGLPVSLVEAQASGLPVFCSDTISSDSKINSNLFFLPLAKNASEWAEYILRKSEKSVNRSTIDNVRQQGFDIIDTTKKLINIYKGTNS